MVNVDSSLAILCVLCQFVTPIYAIEDTTLPSFWEQLYNQTIPALLRNEWITWAMDSPCSTYLFSFICWLRHPIILSFLLPTLIIVFIYLTILLIHVCRLRHWLVQQFARWLPHPDHGLTLSRSDLVNLTQLMKRLSAAFWDAHGRIFHGYEVIGMNKLPDQGPAFVVYYHGTCPFDAYYLIARFCIERDRCPVPVVDRFLFRLPGLRYLLGLFGALEGTVEECAACLNPNLRPASHDSVVYDENPDGCVLLVAPGGVREALFADTEYSVVWGERCGFAKVAIMAGQVSLAIQDLIKRHQWTPSNLLFALCQRVSTFDRWLERQKRRARSLD